MNEINEPLLTREQARELVEKQLGIPLSLSTMNKHVMKGIGPKPAAKYGRRDLYRPSDALEYGKSLIDPRVA